MQEKLKHQVYFVKAENYIKVGVTSGSIEGRLIYLRTGCPFELELLKAIQFPNREEAMKAEKLFHRLFRLHKKHNEWFHNADFIMEVLTLFEVKSYEDLKENFKLAATAIDILGDSYKFDGICFFSETVCYGDGGFHLTAFETTEKTENGWSFGPN